MIRSLQIYSVVKCGGFLVFKYVVDVETTVFKGLKTEEMGVEICGG